MFRMEDAVKYFRNHEGVVSHMYLDVVGLVTVGVGFLLSTARSAHGLAFVRRDTGVLASDTEKAADWDAVRAQPKAKLAKSYKKFTQLDLPDSEIDRRLEQLIADFVSTLRGRFPKFDSFPDKAQIGLLDMIYSLGPKGVFIGFPAFCAAVDAKDWKKCARECKRRNVSDSRNADLQQLFRDAASES